MFLIVQHFQTKKGLDLRFQNDVIDIFSNDGKCPKQSSSPLRWNVLFSYFEIERLIKNDEVLYEAGEDSWIFVIIWQRETFEVSPCITKV